MTHCKRHPARVGSPPSPSPVPGAGTRESGENPELPRSGIGNEIRPEALVLRTGKRRKVGGLEAEPGVRRPDVRRAGSSGAFRRCLEGRRAGGVVLDRLVTLRAASRWRHGETVMVSPPFSRRLQVPRRNRARAMGLAVLVTARVGAGQPVPPPDGEPETPIEIVIVGDAPQPLAAPKDPHVSGSVISG